MEYIRRIISNKILEAFPFYSVIIITGPRQSGKTTLCRNLFPDYKYFNLENPSTRDIINHDPSKFIFDDKDGMVIDEVQYLPVLLSYIQVCVDENPEKKFILTGSSDFALMESITQSLAGRAALFTLLPFSFKEVNNYVKDNGIDKIMLNGFYPGVIVKKTPVEIFYSNYVSTYIERDVRKIKNIENLDLFRLFIKILASRASCEFNASSISAEIGVSATTIRKWLGLLKASYIAFSLYPYYTNVGKRLSKTPKIYFYDTGLLCYMLDIHNESQLQNHPLRGAIFENLVLTQFIKEKFNKKENWELYFYRENKGREIDVVKSEGLHLDLYEIKSSKTFNKDFTKNLNQVKNLLGDKVSSTTLIYDGESFLPDIINVRDI
ncbi:MAG: ATP-binding protein [Muribaculaceae bacterium]|nr:ATP-binding protein [Muribaculaceae bacterium]